MNLLVLMIIFIKNTKINPTTITQVKKYIINNGSNTLFKMKMILNHILNMFKERIEMEIIETQ